jgi:6-phosphogluconolactonase
LKDFTVDNLSQSIAASLSASINLNGYASFVVCGGSSPLPLYDNLSNKDLDWSKVSIFLGDDRVVPSDHQDSNNYLIQLHLLKNNASSASLYPLNDSKFTIKDIRRPFDVVLLGLGDDGHFASLFPAQLNDCCVFDVNASPSIIVSDQDLGSPSHRRISMNLSMLIDSKRCILLVPNSDKRKIVERAYKDNQLPLHFLLNQERTKIEFSDIDF